MLFQVCESLEDNPANEEDEVFEAKPREHEVKSGDTWNSIAAFYDTTPSFLAQTNRMSTSKLLFPGVKLKIPEPEPPKPAPKVERHSVVEEVNCTISIEQI